MSKSEDVQTLFRRFGGNASTYQEVVSRDQVTQAESKWPILGLINPTANQEAPSVRRPSVAPSLRQGQPAAQPQPQPSSVGALAQHHTSSHLPPQPAALVDRPLASAPGGPPPAGMFAALLPAKPASPAQPAVAAMFRPLVSASAAPAPPAHRVEPAPATASVDTRPGAQGGLFNRFKAAMRPAVAVAPVPAPLPAEAVFAPASLPISTAPPAAGGLFAALVPAPVDLHALSAAPVRAPVRGAGSPTSPTPAAESKVVHGSELQALFTRMVPPVVPASTPKKEPKSSKKAVKW